MLNCFIIGESININVSPHFTPVAQPIRKVPIHLEEMVEKKLDEMLNQGIIEMVNEPREWISPMVIVPKPDGSIRICIDMRQANKAIVREKHPLPTLDDILPKLSKSKVFSKFDVKNAFHQLELGKKSRYITTFITKRGLMQYKRLIFGINNAPELFQKTMERILAGCKNVIIYLDDILVFGCSQEEHDTCMAAVKKRLEEANVLLNEEKTETSKTSVHFMGHILSADGIKPSTDKLDAVEKFRRPETPEEVRSFLGLITYLSRFVPNLSTLAEPLRQLIKDGSSKKFVWERSHENTFQEIKRHMLTGTSLSFFNKNDETEVICDASPYGLGAVLMQRTKDKKKRIIMFVSKTLSQAERRYCQTEREALAIVWSIERFHFYLFGRKFTLFTDHKPLTFMFQPLSKPCARIERWVLRLQQYDFVVVYKSGKENIADSFSRLSATDKEPLNFDEESDHYVNAIRDTCITKATTFEEIRDCSKDDPEYLALSAGIEKGQWSKEVGKWKLLAGEFCVTDNIIMRSRKIFIPKSLRQRVLTAAHEGHPGKEKLLQRLRGKVWWPSIAKDAEQTCFTCRPCTLVSAPEKPIPMKMRELPISAWKDLAIDFMSTGPFGKKLLVTVDYYSRFIDIRIQTGETAQETIKSLYQIFPILGFPDSITCDNGEPFISKPFLDFCSTWNIIVHHTPPLYAQANGLVERVNRGIKKRLQISKIESESNWQDDLLVSYLVMYRSSPHNTTGKSPYELMFGRPMKDKIPSFNNSYKGYYDEDVREKDAMEKSKIKERADVTRGAKHNAIEVGDKVFIKSKPGDKLVSNFDPQIYTVIRREGGDCVVKADDADVVRRRHLTFLKKVPPTIDETLHPTNNPITDIPSPPSQGPSTSKTTPTSKLLPASSRELRSPSKRQKKTPKRLEDFVRATK